MRVDQHHRGGDPATPAELPGKHRHTGSHRPMQEHVHPVGDPGGLAEDRPLQGIERPGHRPVETRGVSIRPVGKQPEVRGPGQLQSLTQRLQPPPHHQGQVVPDPPVAPQEQAGHQDIGPQHQDECPSRPVPVVAHSQIRTTELSNGTPSRSTARIVIVQVSASIQRKWCNSWTTSW